MSLKWIPALTVVVLIPLAAKAQTPTPATTPEGELVQAAQAAQQAAQAAQQAAQAAEKAVEVMAAATRPPPPPPAPPAPPPAPPPPPPRFPQWQGNVNLSMISDTGNATAFTGKFLAKAIATWPLWTLTMMGDTAYGEAKPVGTNAFSVTALNAEASVRADRAIVKDLFNVYMLGGAMTDHVQSISYNAFAEAGVSIIWFLRKEADYTKVKVHTDVGFRYAHEVDYQFYPSTTGYVGNLDRPDGGNIYDVVITAGFLYAISKTTLFSEEAQVLEDVAYTEDVQVNSITTIAAALGHGVALQLSFKVSYIGVPATGNVPTNTELAFGVSYTF